MFSKETNHHEFIDASKFYERIFDFINFNFWQDLQSSDIEKGKKSLIESVYEYSDKSTPRVPDESTPDLVTNNPSYFTTGLY